MKKLWNENSLWRPFLGASLKILTAVSWGLSLLTSSLGSWEIGGTERLGNLPSVTQWGRGKPGFQPQQVPSCECSKWEPGGKCPTGSKALPIVHLRLSPNWPERRGFPTLQRRKPAQRGEEVKMERVPDTKLWQLGLILTCSLLSVLQSRLTSREMLQSWAFPPEWTPAPGRPLCPIPRQSAFTSQSLSQGVRQKFPHSPLWSCFTSEVSHLDQELRSET